MTQSDVKFGRDCG